MLDNRAMAESEAAEPVESPTTETEKVETPVEETPEIAKENAEEPEQEATPEPQENPKEEPEQKPENPEETPKPSRAEKKIRNLWQENNQLKQQIESLQNKQAPEFENGEVDAETLNRVITARAIEAAKLMVASQDVDREVQAQAKEWAEDLDNVIKENPELDPKSPEYDAELADTLAIALTDADKNPRFDIKASDLMRTIKRRIESKSSKAKEEGKSEVSATLAKQMQEGAVTPSSKTSQSEEYTQDEIERIQTTNPRLYTELVMKGKI
jgi:hypothetical protein